jgi:hypothetical protein
MLSIWAERNDPRLKEIELLRGEQNTSQQKTVQKCFDMKCQGLYDSFFCIILMVVAKISSRDYFALAHENNYNW